MSRVNRSDKALLDGVFSRCPGGIAMTMVGDLLVSM